MLRISQTTDLDLIAGLDRIVFGDEPLGVLLKSSTWWVAREGGHVVAYAGAELTDDGKYMFLSRAGVLPVARGRGLQKRLIDVRLKWARAQGATHAWTYTSWDNVVSQASLVKRGFVPYTWCEDDDFRGIHFKRAL